MQISDYMRGEKLKLINEERKKLFPVKLSQKCCKMHVNQTYSSLISTLLKHILDLHGYMNNANDSLHKTFFFF